MEIAAEIVNGTLDFTQNASKDDKVISDVAAAHLETNVMKLQLLLCGLRPLLIDDYEFLIDLSSENIGRVVLPEAGLELDVTSIRGQ